MSAEAKKALQTEVVAVKTKWGSDAKLEKAARHNSCTRTATIKAAQLSTKQHSDRPSMALNSRETYNNLIAAGVPEEEVRVAKPCITRAPRPCLVRDRLCCMHSALYMFSV